MARKTREEIVVDTNLTDEERQDIKRVMAIERNYDNPYEVEDLGEPPPIAIWPPNVRRMWSYDAIMKKRATMTKNGMPHDRFGRIDRQSEAWRQAVSNSRLKEKGVRAYNTEKVLENLSADMLLQVVFAMYEKALQGDTKAAKIVLDIGLNPTPRTGEITHYTGAERAVETLMEVMRDQERASTHLSGRGGHKSIGNGGSDEGDTGDGEYRVVEPDSDTSD